MLGSAFPPYPSTPEVEVLPPATGFWLPDFHLDYDALLLSALLLLLYGMTIWQARRRGIGYPVGSGRVAAYVGGVATIFIGASWPLHEISEGYLFGVHMFQHMLFSLLAAPLLLWGTPGWMVEEWLRPRWLLAVARTLARPFVAFMVYNLGVAITHIPEITDVVLRTHSIHFLTHIYLVASSVVLFLPVLSTTPLLPRLNYPLQMIYLILQSAVPTVVYAPLTYYGEVIYRFYAEVPRIWGVDALTDQQMAGLLMKVGGGLIFWGWIIAIFFRWYARSNSGGLQSDFQPVDELTESSAVRAAEDVLRSTR